jgi:hypothetical protein
MTSKGILRLLAPLAFSLAGFAQTTVNEPLDASSAHIEAVDTAAGRQSALRLLSKARAGYMLRAGTQGFDLKVTFTVDSGGQTQYDGVWKMEDQFVPQMGLRWTAQTAQGGYSVTRITANNATWADGTSPVLPLRLHEARVALFDSMPPAANLGHASIRTSAVEYNGAQLTCILLSGSAAAAAGRRADETEECIDPQTGLLRIHSQVPGRYYVYDYADAPRLGARVFPRTVLVTEGGKVVSTISIDSLTGLSSADPALFVPTAAMKAKGEAVAMGAAQKISRLFAQPAAEGSSAEPVCIFGLVTPSGELVEAHSLQPSNPNSAAALADAKQMNFAPQPAPGARPQQHFVFITERFASR